MQTTSIQTTKPQTYRWLNSESPGFVEHLKRGFKRFARSADVTVESEIPAPKYGRRFWTYWGLGGKIAANRLWHL